MDADVPECASNRGLMNGVRDAAGMPMTSPRDTVEIIGIPAASRQPFT